MEYCSQSLTPLKLYGKKGPETRKKYFEKYFPKVGYGKRSDSVGISQLFYRTAVDLDRLQGLVQHVEKSSRNSEVK